MASVSCPAPSFCAAVDNGADAFTFDGTSWSPATAIDPGNQLSTVSCPSASFCAAVDYGPNVLTFDGTSWSKPSAIDPGSYLQAVSCAAASFCVAIDRKGNAFTFNGSSWSAPVNADPNGLTMGEGGISWPVVSCPASNFCAAVDGGSGNVVTFDGNGWSAPVNIDLKAARSVREPVLIFLMSVSCSSARFCAAKRHPRGCLRPKLTDGRNSGIHVIAVTRPEHQDGGMTVRGVLIVLFDRVQCLDVTGPLEVFTGAASFQAGRGADGYAITTASLGGMPVTLDERPRPDPGHRSARVRRGPDRHAGGAGRARHRQARSGADRAAARAHGLAARRITSVCTGAFLLAAAGLLDGRNATTHWAYTSALAKQYPAVTVHTDPIFVRDGQVATSAGVTAGIDLALALVEEDIGHEAALTVARSLVVYLRRPGGQAQFSAHLRAQSAQRAPLREVQQWISEHPAADLSVPNLAARAGLSPRQFARAFAAETGMSPGRFVSTVRLETARRMLEDSGRGVSQVARACGYGTPEAMRRAFVQSLGVPPAGYRHRF